MDVSRHFWRYGSALYSRIYFGGSGRSGGDRVVETPVEQDDYRRRSDSHGLGDRRLYRRKIIACSRRRARGSRIVSSFDSLYIMVVAASSPPVINAEDRGNLGVHWIDLAILLYIAIGAVSGLRRGLVTVLFSLAGYIVGIIIATQYQAALTQSLMTTLPIDRWTRHLLPGPASTVPGYTIQADNLIHMLIALLVFLVIVGAVEFIGRLIGEFLTRVVKTLRITGFLNKLGGAVAGLAEHGILIGLLVTLIFALPLLNHSPLTMALRHDRLVMTLAGLFGHIAKLPGGTFL